MRALPKTVQDPKNAQSRVERDKEWAISTTEIVAVNEIRRIKKKLGQLVILGLVTREGYSYSGAIALPHEPANTVPIIGNSAWLTSLDGHNGHILETFMDAGNIVAFMAAEGSYHPGIKFGGKLCDIRLSKSAATLLSFSGEILNDYAPDVEKRRIVFGESRGAMSGMGVIAFAQDLGQEVVYSDLIAPCFPRRYNPLRDTFHLYRQILTEPIAVISALTAAPLEIITRYPSSIDISPASIAHQIALVPALMSGEAGNLAREISPDVQAHITVFEDDWMSMHAEWESIFNNYPGVRITPLPGSHLTIADNQTRQYVLARNKVLQQTIQDDLPIYADEISAGAHRLVDAAIDRQRPVAA